MGKTTRLLGFGPGNGSKRLLTKHGRLRIPEIKRQVIDVVAHGWSITRAGEKVDVSYITICNWRKKDKDFDAAIEAAYHQGTDRIEDEAYRRAVQGTQKPVFYQGEECAVVTEYSDSLLTTLLKGRRPEVYRDRLGISGPNGGPVETVDVTARELLASRIAQLAARGTSGGGPEGNDGGAVQ